jgi:purine-binding chemotaxis protein CheW
MNVATQNQGFSAASVVLADHDEYVTVLIADHLFGVPIDRVHDVFVATAITPVPLAMPEVVGLLNLRGRVVTAISLRRRLGLPDLDDIGQQTAIGLEHGAEAYGLLVDAVGEVMRIDRDTREPNPVHLDARWMRFARGVHRLDGRLLIILDVDATLTLESARRA